MKVVTTKRALAKAFEEWDRRYREEPERFASEMEVAAAGSEDYGDKCAPYLIKILEEQKEK